MAFAHPHPGTRGRRRAAAVVELAVLLPFLMFVFIIGVDFARVFYHCVTLVNCARNGAVYGSRDPTHAADTAGIQAAALADATNLKPAPTITVVNTTDADGHPCVQVTAAFTFRMITSYAGIPSSFDLSRTVQMRVAPAEPKNS
jgi:Flp pilus assembly protein TadG